MNVRTRLMGKVIFKCFKKRNSLKFITILFDQQQPAFKKVIIYISLQATHQIIYHSSIISARINQQGLIESHNLWLMCDKSEWDRKQ